MLAAYRIGMKYNPAPDYHDEDTRPAARIVTRDGQAKDIGIGRSGGFNRLDKASRDAVRRCKFRPGMQAGTPVETTGLPHNSFQLPA